MSRKLATGFHAALVLLVAAQTASAHPGHFGHEFGDGALHPLFGLDHLLAMVAVGLLAARLGGAAIWQVPATFLGTMFAGGILGALGMPVPAAEYVIALSVLVLGLLVALGRTVSPKRAMLLVGAFALFHGHAHAAEMAAQGSFGGYATGFLLSTAMLHATGIGLALGLSRLVDPRAVRLCGAAISAASLLILVPMISG
ncbi:MAG: HupE/UreJ family protein [Pirellulales bacterium]|nr:HupE/UreJ family protein [Pirellulales bacterium]